MDRRAFLKTGFVYATAAAAGVSLYGCSDLDILNDELIDDEVTVALSAVLPVFLAGVLPKDPAQRQQKIARTIEGIRFALTRLPPHTLDEINDLFSLLTSRVATLAMSGSFAELNDLSHQQKVILIETWRNSYFSLLNTAYDGLKELIFAAFYGNPDNWTLLQYQKPNLGV